MPATPWGRNVAMTGWIDDIEKLTLDNDNFRTVVFTGGHTQLTLMSIEPGSEIGWEMHDHLDQFLRIEQGSGEVDLGSSADTVDETKAVEDDWAIIVPAGTWHNVTSIGDEPLKVYALYAPPEHPHGTVHATKAEADADEHHH